jgi:hypothetical protein
VLYLRYYRQLLVLFKICKIISNDLIFCNDKINLNKIYDNFFKKLNKTNGVTKQSMVIII